MPVVKGWSTENAVDVTSLGVQVHGGMGFIEETGAAQYYRDARILPIYEGTTAIQANDLLGRKTLRDGGAVARALAAAMQATAAEARAAGGEFAVLGTRLDAGVEAFAGAVDYLLATAAADARAAYAGSVPYLKLAGIVLGGWQMTRAALAAQRHLAAGDAFHRNKIATARFYADHVLSGAPALAQAIGAGGAGALALDAEDF